MKNIILLIVLLLSVFSFSSANVIFNTDSMKVCEKEVCALPVVDVVQDDCGMTVEYSFSEVSMAEIGQAEYAINIPSFATTSAPGSYMLPKAIEYFEVPKVCKNIKISQISSEKVHLPFKIAKNLGMRNDRFRKGGIVPCGSLVTSSKNAFGVMILPYDIAAEDSIYLLKRLRFRIDFINENIDAPNGKSKLLAKGKASALPSAALRNLYNKSLKTAVSLDSLDSAPMYFILSTKEYSNAIDKLVDWKKLLGYNVMTFYVEDLPTPETVFTPEIIDFLVECAVLDYGNINLKYVLAIGNESVVQMHVCGKDMPEYNEVQYDWSELPIDMVKSDADYFSRNPNDIQLPKGISSGRIPAYSLSEADRAIQKIIEYEKNDYLSTFKSSATFCGRFIDLNLDGREDYNLIRILEDIKSIFIRPPYFNSSFFYSADSNVSPKYWNELYQGDKNIPDELKKPNYTWVGNTSNLTNSIFNGTLFLSYIGDSSESSWKYPYHYAYSINKGVQNQQFPIVISLADNTGRISNKSLGRGFLSSHADRGAVAVFASDTLVNMQENAYLLDGIHRAAFPDVYNYGLPHHAPGKIVRPGQVIPKPEVHLGDLLECGYAYLNSKNPDGYMTSNLQTKLMTSIFGDPGLLIGYVPRPEFEVSSEAIPDGKEYLVSLNVYWYDYIMQWSYWGNLERVAEITVVDKCADKVYHIHGNACLIKVKDPTQVEASVRFVESRPILVSSFPIKTKAKDASLNVIDRTGNNVTLEYELPESDDNATISIVSVSGQQTTIPCNHDGRTTVSFDRFSSGIYKVCVWGRDFKTNTITIVR